MNEKAIQEITAILKRGNDVEIRRSNGGIVILEVKKEVKHRA